METNDYFWGPVTSTIDWCEENYVISSYIAEFFNTTTNIFFALLSLFGIYNTLRNKFNKSFVLAHFGVLFVGFGSWCFHMTLQYEMQLLDELPMIYVACIMVWHIFEVHPGNIYGAKLVLFLVGYSAAVTWSYLIIKNPIFHQVAYALLILVIVVRSVYVTRLVPATYAYENQQLIRLMYTAALAFVLAFGVWNIDNQCCAHLRGWRASVPRSVGALSELHGWWHIGTGLGAYYFVVFTEWIHQILKGNKQRYQLKWTGIFCYLRPKEKTK